MAEVDTATEAAAASIDTQQAEAEARAEPVTVESLAKSMGWTPQEEWRGAGDKWKPADQFLRTTIDVNRSLSHEVKATRKQIDQMARTSASIVERQVAEAKAQLEARFEQAVEAGDTKGARAVTAEIARLDASKPDVADSAVSDFITRNRDWFEKDDEATAYAVSISQRLAGQGKSQAEQVEAAETAVRKRFPELFKDTVSASRAAPEVNAPNSRASAPTRGGKAVSDLPPSARKAGEMFVAKGLVKDLASYAKSWFEENAQ